MSSRTGDAMGFVENGMKRKHSGSNAYELMKPILQSFVEGVLAGEKPTHVVRRLRPDLKAPSVRATKWLARADVKAALAERHSPDLRLAVAAEGIERRLAAIESLLRKAFVEGARGAK